MPHGRWRRVASGPAGCAIVAATLVLGACDGDGSKPGDDRLLSVTVDGQNRIFTLYVPGRYDDTRGAPLLFAFHGTPGNGPGMRRSTRLDEIADDAGWLIAYPDGLNGEWSAGCLCSGVERAGVDDLEFVNRMIARIRSEYTVDAKRIYSVGFSTGGIMNYRIACDLGDTFAATASVASSMTWAQAETCDPDRPVSILAMVGTDDDSFPWQGTGPGDGQRMPVDSTFHFWARADHCGPDATVDYSPPNDNGHPVRRERFPGCAAGSEVLRYVIAGGMHAWPATANATLQSFFQRHALPE